MNGFYCGKGKARDFDDLSPETKKKLARIFQKYQKQQQSICDKPGSGITSISISFPDIEKGKEFIIAEKGKK
jgi:hypothetical protein